MSFPDKWKSKIQPWLRLLAIVVAINCGLIVLLTLISYATRNLWLPWVGSLLVCNDANSQGADGLIILMGDVEQRTPFAADLWKGRTFGGLYFARPKSSESILRGLKSNDADLTLQALARLNIPRDRIEVLSGCEATSTFDEAHCLHNHFRGLGGKVRDLVVVTSWFHSCRAAWIFRKVFAPSGINIRLMSSPISGIAAHNWWRDEYGFLLVFEEYLKWVFYLWHY